MALTGALKGLRGGARSGRRYIRALQSFEKTIYGSLYNCGSTLCGVLRSFATLHRKRHFSSASAQTICLTAVYESVGHRRYFHVAHRIDPVPFSWRKGPLFKVNSRYLCYPWTNLKNGSFSGAGLTQVSATTPSTSRRRYLRL